MPERKEVTIYTDGSCVGNPGPGGFAAVLIHGDHRREVTGGYRRTTNNRMELKAAVAALEALKVPCRVTLHSDARYVVDGMMNGAMRRWRGLGWRRGGSVVPNADLWDELLALCERHEVRFVWVQGHAGHTENERCDQLAECAALLDSDDIDQVYEYPIEPPDPQLKLFDPDHVRRDVPHGH